MSAEIAGSKADKSYRGLDSQAFPTMRAQATWQKCSVCQTNGMWCWCKFTQVIAIIAVQCGSAGLYFTSHVDCLHSSLLSLVLYRRWRGHWWQASDLLQHCRRLQVLQFQWFAFWLQIAFSPMWHRMGLGWFGFRTPNKLRQGLLFAFCSMVCVDCRCSFHPWWFPYLREGHKRC